MKKSKMNLRVKILFLVWCLAIMSRAQSPCALNNKSFTAGETLHYQLYYNLSFLWIQAGACEFRVRSAYWNNKPVYQLMAHGKTQKSFDPLFRVRDTIVSYVDSNNMFPFQAYKFAHEDNWRGVDEFSFSQESNGWKVTTRLKRKKGWKEPIENHTNRCGFDLVTSIYRLRCLSDEALYVLGRPTEIPVRLDDGEYTVSLTYLGKKRIKLYGDGYYMTHAFQMTMVEGAVFKRGDVLKMWLSDDKNKIPLLIESPIKVGTVKAVFKGAERTLYPLAKPTK